MKQVNAALRDIGIPVYAGVWRATSPNQNPPVQYCVYSTTTTEATGLRRRLAGHFAQPESARAVLRLFHDHHGSQPP